MLINDDASDSFPSFISTTRRLKSSSRMWWASWRPIRSNLRSATLPLTRITGSGWGRTFRRSPGQPRGILSHRRFSMKANIVGWETRARFDLRWCCWFNYSMTDTCMQGLHEAGHGGIPVWVPVTVKKKESQLVEGCGHFWATLVHQTPKCPGQLSPSVGACACANIILYV